MSDTDPEGALFDLVETSPTARKVILSKKSKIVEFNKKVHFNEDIKIAYYESICEDDSKQKLDGHNQIYIREDGTYSLKEILHLYSKQCNDLNISARNDEIYQQLEAIKRTYDYSAVLNINKLILTADRITCLRVVFRLITFKTIYINTVQLLNHDFLAILIQQDSVKEFVVNEIYHRAILWEDFAKIIKASRIITSLTFRDISVGKDMCVKLQEAINSHLTLTILKFEGCHVLSSLNYLLSYSNINEIHISNCNLVYQHCEFIAYHLMFNSTLCILDLSHNKIDDNGFELVVKVIFEKRDRPHGISELVLLDNKLTTDCFDAVNLLLLCKRLRVLNLSCNNLGDCFISSIKENLIINSSIEGLGLQNIGLASHSLMDLQEICVNNTTLLHLIIKENSGIEPYDLEEFARSIHKTSLIHCDFDVFPEAVSEGCYATIKMKRILSLKRKIWNLVNNKSWCPDKSMLCFSDYAPPVKLKNRFEVTRIQEDAVVASTSKPTPPKPAISEITSNTHDSISSADETDSFG